jgi:predicted metallopeptidase
MIFDFFIWLIPNERVTVTTADKSLCIAAIAGETAIFKNGIAFNPVYMIEFVRFVNIYHHVMKHITSIALLVT